MFSKIASMFQAKGSPPPSPGQGWGGSRALGFSDVWGSEAEDIDGISTSADKALRTSAVYACTKVLAETIGTLPLHLYRRKGDDSEREENHPLAQFLRDAPNGKMTWPEAREALAASVVLRGNAFAGIAWENGFPAAVVPYLVDQIAVCEEDNGLVYYYYPNGGEETVIRSPDIAHFKGVSFSGLLGISPISACSYAIATAAAQADHGYKTFSKGTRMTGILTLPRGSMKDDTLREKLRTEWQAQMDYAREGTGTAILTEGITYNGISMSLADAQFIEAMKFSTEDIARIFRVPLHKIQHLDRATNNNIEHQSLEFYRDTILPWLAKIEAVMDRILLTASDRREGYFFRHNVDGILRGDFTSRMGGYQIAIGNGIMTRNEVRKKEKLAPYKGGDRPLIPLNMGGTPPPGQEGTGNTGGGEPRGDRQEDSDSIDLSMLCPVVSDALRALQAREENAFKRARGKEDEGERLEKFLNDHRRAAAERLAPILESARGLGLTADVAGIGAALAKVLTDGASKRFAGKEEPHPDGEQIITLLENHHEKQRAEKRD